MMQFQDGETEVIGGVTYVRQNGQWTPAAGAPAPAMGGAPGPVYGAKPLPKAPPAPRGPDFIPGIPGVTLGPNNEAVPITGLPPEALKPPTPMGEKDLVGIQDQIAGVNVFESAITDLEDQYTKKFRGSKGNILGFGGAENAAGGLPSRIGPIPFNTDNKTFNDTADSMIGTIMKAFGMTGGEVNSVAEAKMRFGPLLPNSQDTDESIERKITALKALAAQQRIAVNQKAKQYGVPDVARPDGAAGITGSRLSPEKEAELVAFAQTRPTAEALRAKYKELGGTDDINAEEIVKGVGQGRPLVDSVGYDKTDEAAAARARARVQAEDKTSLFGGDSAIGTMVNAGVPLTDEAAGIGNAAYELITGGSPSQGYTEGRDAQRLRVADARQQLGGWGTAAEVVGSLAMARPGAAMGALAAAPVRQQIVAGAKGGGAGGALVGYGSGEGVDDSLRQGAIGLAGGAAAGGALTGVLARVAQPRGMNPEIAAAAQAEDVRLIRPMVDPASRGKAGALESSPSGQNVMREGIAGVTDDIERGVMRKVGPDGAPETGDVGRVIQRGAQQFITKSKGVADRLYNRARSLAGDVAFSPTKAIQRADDELATLARNEETNETELAFLQRIRNDLAKEGGKTVEDIRQLRTTLRGAINAENLTATQAEARASRMIDAAVDDIASNIPRGAASAFRRADMYYRERMVHIDDVLDRFIGTNKAGEVRLSGEEAFKKLKAMASPGGDGRRLGAMMRNLDPSERQDIASTIAASLGRAGPEEAFSPALFVSQVKNLSPSARRTIFGPDGAESISRLTMLSRSIRDTGSDINRSRTSGSLARQVKTWIGSMIGMGGMGVAAGGGTGAAIGVSVAASGMALAAGRQYLSARAMVNPRIASFLASAADATTPGQLATLKGRLAGIAAREPALAADIALIRSSFPESMSRAAASPNGGDNEQP